MEYRYIGTSFYNNGFIKGDIWEKDQFPLGNRYETTEYYVTRYPKEWKVILNQSNNSIKSLRRL